MKMNTFLISISCCNFIIIDSANILGIFPINARSHIRFNEAIMRSLHKAGHNITIFAYPDLVQDNSMENYTIIPVNLPSYIRPFQEQPEKYASTSIFEYQQKTLPKITLFLQKFQELPEFQNILLGKSNKFDLVIGEYILFYQYYLNIARKLQASVIITIPLRYGSRMDRVVGNSIHTSIMPTEVYLIPTKMDIHERILNFLNYIYINVLMLLITNLQNKDICNEFFIQSSEKSKKSVSLILQNGHPSLLSRPLVPNTIEVGGIYMQSTNPLPEKIQKFIDEAPHGVILFTFGSISKGAGMSPRTFNAFKNAFAKIPQRVIWKYEEPISELPNNVMTLDWVPQRSILAHRNVKAFITHAGISGVYEAIYESVPLILVPIFGDQLPTTAKLRELNVGLYLNLFTLTENDVLESINLVVNDTRYRENMKKLSRILRDTPMSQEESVIYWVEYVIKHKGAPHLKAASLDLPFYQNFLFYIFSFTTIIFILIFLFIRHWITHIIKIL